MSHVIKIWQQIGYKGSTKWSFCKHNVNCEYCPVSLFFAIRSLKLKVVMVVHIICIIAMILPCQHAEDQVKIFLMRKKVEKFNCRINWRSDRREVPYVAPIRAGRGRVLFIGVIFYIITLSSPVCGRLFI